MSSRTNRLLRVQQRLGRRGVVRLFTIIDLKLKVTNLTIDIKPKTSGATELKHLAAWAPVILGTIANANRLGVTIEFTILDARHAIYSACSE